MAREKTAVAVMTEEHHRRPRSLGGKSSPSNVSYVPKKEHRAYHIIWGNKNIYQIRDDINLSPLNLIGRPDDEMVICRFINGERVENKGENNSKKQKRVNRAYEILFKGMTFQEKISYLNNVFLDPSYHFYIRKKKK
ncbi:MAG TPA: hypothetical protein PKZ36_03320 [Candidatus Paceibacterota bacterium]|nr:hypothetical protein [Candidatus Paceibacterota bacterium]HPT18407.1 hypothetical protein [Candidatus Paceibacterota bacterium]